MEMLLHNVYCENTYPDLCEKSNERDERKAAKKKMGRDTSKKRI